ncbi:hypothetical protein BIV25_44800 [Streptomyces sp. MUSC 14]|nr:hypothetical protein BIV25_44800 [Streptomyces sp. MUSC 14]
MAITRARKALITGAVGALAATGSLLTLSTAQAEPQTAPAAATATDMPTTAETWDYPGAAKIAEEKGIALKRGDGHITLTDCTQPYDLQVRSRLGHFCFAVNSNKGLLTLELPDSFGIDNGAHPVTATLDAGGKESVVKAPVNDYTPMGESGDSGKRSILVELRVTG